MKTGFGAFGKIAGMGDFLRLNLPGEFVRPVDEWLQAGLLAARQALGQAWEGHYLSAPIWRFSLPGGVVGPQAASGVLMASVDRVGRQYPLTIGALCPPGNTALRHFANTPVFARLEDIALGTLEDDATRCGLQDALEGLELTAPAEMTDPGDIYSGSLPPELVLAARMIDERCGEVGIWTTQVRDEHRMMLIAGLPDARQFAALFDLDAPLWQGVRLAPSG